MFTDVKTLFSDRFQHLRMQKGLTQSALASDLVVSQSTITSYELADKFPKPDMLLRIAQYFNVTIDYLLGYSDYPYKPSNFDEIVVKLGNQSITVSDILSGLERLSPQAKKDICYLLLNTETKQKEGIERLISAIRFMIEID